MSKSKYRVETGQIFRKSCDSNSSNHTNYTKVAPWQFYRTCWMPEASPCDRTSMYDSSLSPFLSLPPLLVQDRQYRQCFSPFIPFPSRLHLHQDASLLSTEYTDNSDVQTTYNKLVYSVKLKMKFTMLNSLLNVIRADPSTTEALNNGT
jgi:hypothetical protein